MFDIGFSELALVLVVSLVVIGPKQLPLVAEKLGRWLRYFRNLMLGLQQDLQRSESHNEP